MAARRPHYLFFWITLTTMFTYMVVSDFMERRPAETRSEVPLPADDRIAVQGWRGPTALSASGVDLILAPLHASAERQAFDAGALAERLALEPGEPWRLEVRALDAQGMAAFTAAAEGGQIELVDADGVAAALMVERVDQAALEPAALPILQLFAGDAPQEQNQQFVGRWVLWGRRPLAACTLVVGSERMGLVPAALGREEIPRFVASRQ